MKFINREYVYILKGMLALVILGLLMPVVSLLAHTGLLWPALISVCVLLLVSFSVSLLLMTRKFFPGKPVRG